MLRRMVRSSIATIAICRCSAEAHSMGFSVKCHLRLGGWPGLITSWRSTGDEVRCYQVRSRWLEGLVRRGPCWMTLSCLMALVDRTTSVVVQSTWSRTSCSARSSAPSSPASSTRARCRVTLLLATVAALSGTKHVSITSARSKASSAIAPLLSMEWATEAQPLPGTGPREATRSCRCTLAD